MNKILAVLKLTRIEHSVMLVLAVLAAELIVGGLPSPVMLLLSIIAPVFISASSFAINDYYDVDVDRANKRRERPIVSGDISKNGALLIAIVSVIIGFVAAMSINTQVFLIAVIFGLLAFFYSYKLKDVVLAGNMYIALAMAIPFIFGNLVVSDSVNTSIILIMVLVFTAGLAREIHGMIRDKKGDALRKTKNLLTYVGDRQAALMALVLYIESVLLSLFLFFFRYPFLNNAAYIFPTGIADIVILYVAFNFVWKRNRRFYDLARNLSLGAMGVLTITYLICALVFIPV